MRVPGLFLPPHLRSGATRAPLETLRMRLPRLLEQPARRFRRLQDSLLPSTHGITGRAASHWLPAQQLSALSGPRPGPRDYYSRRRRQKPCVGKGGDQMEGKTNPTSEEQGLPSLRWWWKPTRAWVLPGFKVCSSLPSWSLLQPHTRSSPS